MRKGMILTIAVLAAGSLLSAQVRREVGVGVVPASSIESPEDIGVRSHTHYLIYAPDGVVRPMASPGGETPGSLGCVYDLVSSPVSGCPIATSTEVPTGGSGVIVIVDAYHYPGASKDLSTFSKEFGLPSAKLSVLYASGKPANGCSSGWQLEEALDIQWAHAMAPNAQIVLMEAKSNLNTDLYAAVKAANSYIASHGGKGEVSMSWGSSEYSGETANDVNFKQSNVVYFASSGDSPGVSHPSASPKVVSAGGTKVNRNGGGKYTNQTAWSSGGGGTSKYEARPSFQSSVSSIVGTKRGTPDLSFDSSGGSPVAVYNSSCYGGWLQVYGTSVASPALAGIINNAGTFNASSNSENTEIYNNRNNTSDFTDITSGSCGTHSAKKGYDLCTGVGVDKSLSMK
jgi:subtilase family serine protease